MSKLAIRIKVDRLIKLDRRKLHNYAVGVRERFEMPDKSSVSMEDIVAQAVIDGDLPDLVDFSYNLDDSWEQMNDDDLRELSNG